MNHIMGRTHVQLQYGVVFMPKSWTPAAATSPLLSQPLKGTVPEHRLAVLLRIASIRYRTQRRFPGLCTADFFLPEYFAVVFVDGCWWHQCPFHKHWRPSGPNRELWTAKFERNVKRDRKVARALRDRGFHVFRVRECRLAKDPGRELNRIRGLLSRVCMRLSATSPRDGV
jgi:DNA mismatch endonuclease, patch repair protein